MVKVDVEFGGWWTYFYTERLEIRNPFSGELLFASWEGGTSFVIDLPELTLAYELSPCASVREQSMSRLSTRLVVSGPLTTTTDPGEQSRVGPYLIVNGRSHILFEVHATDIRGGSASGYVVRL